MARIICFSDSAPLTYAVRQGLSTGEHTIELLSASYLSQATRDAVCRFTADIILLEATRSLDNAYLFFFLRADQVTRTIPVILISTHAHVNQQASALGANGYLQGPFGTEQLTDMIAAHMPLAEALVAA